MAMSMSSSSSGGKKDGMALPSSTQPDQALHSPDPVVHDREVAREVSLAEQFEREQHEQHERDKQRFIMGQSFGASAEAAAERAASRGSPLRSARQLSGERGERKAIGGRAIRPAVLHGHGLPAKIEAALVKQASSEFASANAYLAASLWFDERSLKGFAHYMMHESKDELREGYAILQYIIQRRGHYRVRDIPAPKNDFDTAEKLIESLYHQEVKTANNINDLVSMCRSTGDVNTELFLHKFVRHQTDACDTMHSLLEKVQAYEATPGLLYNMDKDILHHGEDSIRGRKGGRAKDADAGAGFAAQVESKQAQ